VPSAWPDAQTGQEQTAEAVQQVLVRGHLLAVAVDGATAMMATKP
jgi:hypothetical protein